MGSGTEIEKEQADEELGGNKKDEKAEKAEEDAEKDEQDS